MLRPVARSRASLAAAVLLTAAAGGAVLAGESSPSVGPAALSVPAPAAAVTYGPVVPRRPVAPARPAVVGPGAPAQAVREVQRLLTARGAALVVDGTWGPATERAVRAAQARAGLPVDGRVGPATRAALD